MSGLATRGHAATPRNPAPSPAELLMRFLKQNADPTIVPAGAVVGGATDEAQQAGVIAVMDAGSARTDLYAPVAWERCQLRCMGPSLGAVDAIGNHAYELCEQQALEVEDDEGTLWLVHAIWPATRPSHHIDSEETWESLLFVNIAVGRDPIKS